MSSDEADGIVDWTSVCEMTASGCALSCRPCVGVAAGPVIVQPPPPALTVINATRPLGALSVTVAAPAVTA